MGAYAYCVAPAGHSPPSGLRGLNGAEVSTRVVDDLAVALSEIDRPNPDVAHIQQHNAVIEAIVTPEVTPVPLRFGQWTEDWTVFDGAVREKAEWYRERLSVFAGAMEFGLRVLRPQATGPARDVREIQATTGAEYMKALHARVTAERSAREKIDEVSAGISEVLGDLTREARLEEARTPHGVISVSHLVSRDDFDEYRQRAQGLRMRFPELRFLISGPWVPYSFAV